MNATLRVRPVDNRRCNGSFVTEGNERQRKQESTEAENDGVTAPGYGYTRNAVRELWRKEERQEMNKAAWESFILR